MYKRKGFALAQALFFMMFLMAMMGIILMLSLQKEKRNEGERMAVDAYPVVSAFLNYAVANQASLPIQGISYFTNNPISNDYCHQLYVDGLIPSNGATPPQPDCQNWSNNLTLSVE